MFKTPVLFLIFNRPDTTALVFKQIRILKPAHLYVAADGPRINMPGEKQLCKDVRSIVLGGIDWDCTVETLLRDENQGCKLAVSGALDWFFEKVQEGIILEDDCLPDQSFFPFAEQMLEKYRDNENIIAVNGCNYGFNYEQSSYFFSRYMNAWGWATWRRSAKKIHYEIPGWAQQQKISFLRSRLKKQEIDLDLPWFQYWEEIFDMISTGQLDTWDFFWLYHQFMHRQKNIISSKNLIKNIGFSDNATHTTLQVHPASNLQVHELQFPLINPRNDKINRQYEEDFLKPVCYMFKSKPNSFYIKMMISKLAGRPSISKAFQKNKF